MDSTLRLSIIIHSEKSAIWQVLTNNVMFLDCFKVLEMECENWIVGGKIYFKGVNTNLIDIATITDCIIFNKLSYFYQKSHSEQTQFVSFEIESIGKDVSKLILRGSNFIDEEEFIHSKKNWKGMLESLRYYLESKKGDYM